MENDRKWYLAGKKLGRSDALQDIKRNLSEYPPAFVKGYKETARESWWYRMNDKITNALARMGSSRLK